MKNFVDILTYVNFKTLLTCELLPQQLLHFGQLVSNLTSSTEIMRDCTIKIKDLLLNLQL